MTALKKAYLKGFKDGLLLAYTAKPKGRDKQQARMAVLRTIDGRKRNRK